MSINMEWYRVFYWTAKLGGLTSAANKLHITQPAVSHTLKQLEEAIGGKLFFRTPKGVTLTSEGEVLYSFVSQAMHLISLGEKQIQDMHNLHFGEISVGASDTMCKHYLLPYLKHFSTQFPEIKIRVINRTTPEIITLLKEGEIDFGVVNLPVEDQRIHFHKSAIQQDCLVASPKYAHLAQKPFNVKDLQHYPLLLLEQGGITRSYLEEYALAQGASLQPEFELGSVDLLIQFAQSHFGLTFVVRDYIAEELSSGALIEIPLSPPIPDRHIGIATLRDVPLSAASKYFYQFIIAESELN